MDAAAAEEEECASIEPPKERVPVVPLTAGECSPRANPICTCQCGEPCWRHSSLALLGQYACASRQLLPPPPPTDDQAPYAWSLQRQHQDMCTWPKVAVQLYGGITRVPVRRKARNRDATNGSQRVLPFRSGAKKGSLPLGTLLGHSLQTASQDGHAERQKMH